MMHWLYPSLNHAQVLQHLPLLTGAAVICLVAAWFFGGIFNRVAGGWFATGESDGVAAAAFAVLCGGADSPLVWGGVLGAGAMFAGRMPGWGRYFGAMTGTNAPGAELKEFWLIDWMILWARRWPRLWGALGTFGRGMFWAACPYAVAVFLAWWAAGPVWAEYFALHMVWAIPLGGLAMPVCYMLPFTILGANGLALRWNWWAWGEVSYGSVVWPLAVYLNLYAVGILVT